MERLEMLVWAFYLDWSARNADSDHWKIIWRIGCIVFVTLYVINVIIGMVG